MSRIRSFFHRKRKRRDKLLMNLRRKRYKKKNSLTMKDKCILDYQKVLCMISECLVDNSKQHRSDADTIEDIRKYLNKAW